MTLLSIQVAASADDADEDGGFVNLTRSTVKLTSSAERGGFRFQNITIPAGSTINSAVIKITAANTSNDDPDDVISGQDIADAPAFSGASNDLTGRTLTTANVTWSATGIGTASVDSPDISAIIQEIVDRGDWSSGGAIVILFYHQSAAAFRVRSYDGFPSDAATLEIDYTAPSPPTPTPTVTPFIPFTPPFVAAEYTVWLATPAGQRIKLLTTSGPNADILRLEYLRVVNTPGVLSMRLRDDSLLDLIQVDSRFIIERRLPGGSSIDTDTFWFCRDWSSDFSNGNKTVEIDGVYSALWALDGPIIAYASGSSQASKSTYIDDMMKAIVRENRGSLVIDSDRQISLLSVEADASAGPSTTQSFARKNVLATLKDLYAESLESSMPVYYDIDAAFTFRTYTGQRGSDHGLASGQPVILSIGNGTLQKVRRSYISSGERNSIYVGGTGKGEDRLVGTAIADDRIGISPVNRREMWREASNVNNLVELQAIAQAELSKYQPRETFSVEMVDIPAIRYGREWSFGDRVVVDHEGVRDALVNQVQIRLENGVETIGAKLVVI